MQVIQQSTTKQQQRERLFMELYRSAFPRVAHYVSRKGGSFEQAKDVFQDALIIYYEKMTGDSTAKAEKPEAYLCGIAKHLWLQKFREGIHAIPLEEHLSQSHTDETGEGTPSSGRLMHYLSTAGKKCMDLLRAYYYDKLPMQQLKLQFSFGSVRSATVQKYKCLQKVRETVKQKALEYDDFLE